MKKTYIVIGSSAAGMGAVGSLAQLDSGAEIICISDEFEMPYNKCLLPDYLGGDKQLEEIFTRPKEFFDAHKITLLRGKRVTRINPIKQTVVLANGSELGYHKLLIAMGARPRSIANKATNLFYSYSLHDILRLKKYCESNKVKTALVIGAGLTGMECADALAQNGIKISVLESNEQPLGNIVDKEAAQVVRTNAENYCVDFFLNEKLTKITQNADLITEIKTDRDRGIRADAIVFANGSEQNIELAQEAGIEICENGILVDEHLQTSDENIFAAGDCIATVDRFSGKSCKSFKWADAVAQGVCAAYSMSGHDRKYAGILRILSSFFFGKKFFVIGQKDMEYETEFNKSVGHSYVSCKLRDGRINAVQIIGYEQQVPILRQWYAAQENITIEKVSQLFNV